MLTVTVESSSSPTVLRQGTGQAHAALPILPSHPSRALDQATVIEYAADDPSLARWYSEDLLRLGVYGCFVGHASCDVDSTLLTCK